MPAHLFTLQHLAKDHVSVAGLAQYGRAKWRKSNEMVWAWGAGSST